MSQDMPRVVIGMDPHKRTATIEVMTADEIIVGGGQFTTDTDGYTAMRDVACQRDGTTVLPRAWDHLEVLVSMADLVSGVNGDAPALPVGGAFDDEGVGS